MAHEAADYTHHLKLLSHLITLLSRELDSSSTSNLNRISQHCIRLSNSSFPSPTSSTPAFFCAFTSYQLCSHATNRGNLFHLKPDGLHFFPMRVMKHWSRLPREAVAAPSLAGFKARLDGAVSNLVWWKMSLLMAGGLEPDDL